MKRKIELAQQGGGWSPVQMSELEPGQEVRVDGEHLFLVVDSPAQSEGGEWSVLVESIGPAGPRPLTEHNQVEEGNSWGFGRGSLNYRTGEWEGVGKQKPFDHAVVGGRRVPLLHGEHPHSRRDSSIYAVLHDEPEPFSGHRRHVKITLETCNYLKDSFLSGSDVRRSGQGYIYVDDVPCAEFGFREVEDGLHLAQAQLRQLFGGGVMGGAWDDAELRAWVGRLVYLGHVPAVVTRVSQDRGEVFVEPANEEGAFPPSPWCVEEAIKEGRDPVEEWREHGYHDGQMVSMTSRNLWTYREVPAPRDAELVAKAREGGVPTTRMAVRHHAERLWEELQQLLQRNKLDAQVHVSGYQVGLVGEGVRFEVLSYPGDEEV